MHEKSAFVFISYLPRKNNLNKNFQNTLKLIIEFNNNSR